jgi:hypothetical protein
MSTNENPLTPEERDRLAAGQAAYETFQKAFPTEDWGRPWDLLDDLVDDARQGWADIAEAASDEISAHVNLERDARIQHLEELLTEILGTPEVAMFAPRVTYAEWRERAGIEQA